MTLLYVIGAIVITFLITKNIYKPKVEKVQPPSIYEQNFNSIKQQKIEILESQLSKLKKLGDRLEYVGNRIDDLKI